MDRTTRQRKKLAADRGEVLRLKAELEKARAELQPTLDDCERKLAAATKAVDSVTEAVALARRETMSALAEREQALRERDRAVRERDEALSALNVACAAQREAEEKVKAEGVTNLRRRLRAKTERVAVLERLLPPAMVPEIEGEKETVEQVPLVCRVRLPEGG